MATFFSIWTTLNLRTLAPVAHSARLRAQDFDGEFDAKSVAIFAATYDHPIIADYLAALRVLQFDADIAAPFGAPVAGFVEYLLNTQILVDNLLSTHEEGQTTLAHVAATHSHVNLLRQSVEDGVAPEAQDEQGRSVKQLAELSESE
eukprot:SAG31_NODE_21304_length_553_cov_0.528634_1_plen_146_part_10